MVQDGDLSPLDKRPCVLLVPIENATTEDHAGEALTAMVGSALVERGWAVATPPPQPVEEDAYTEADYLRLAAERGCVALVRGTVHEFRYKTDLNGHPAAGLTLSAVAAADARLLWQGTASNVGFSYSSLTSATQSVSKKLVRRIPDIDELPVPPKPAPKKPALPEADKSAASGAAPSQEAASPPSTPLEFQQEAGAVAGANAGAELPAAEPAQTPGGPAADPKAGPRAPAESGAATPGEASARP